MSNPTENLIEYAVRVNTAMEKREPFSTYNRDILHASEIVACILKYAEEEVNLLSNKLDKRLYGEDYIAELVEDFVGERNGKLNILLETDVETDHPVITACKKFPKNTTVKKVPDQWQKHYDYNFMLIDDIGYRFEANRKSQNAIVSFNQDNQIETRKNMKKCFDVLAEHSELIEEIWV